MTPSRLSRAESMERTRQHLLDAAWQLFAEQGYTDTTLDQIAERAGLTRTPIYSHFGDKEGLFYALWLDRGWPVALPSEVSTPGTSIRQFVRDGQAHREDRLKDPDVRLKVELSLVVGGLLARHQRLRAAYELEMQSVMATAASEIETFACAARESLPLSPDRLALLITACNLGLMQMSLWPSLGVTAEDFRYVQLAILDGPREDETPR